MFTRPSRDRTRIALLAQGGALDVPFRRGGGLAVPAADWSARLVGAIGAAAIGVVALAALALLR